MKKSSPMPKNVLIMGLGKTGKSAANFFAGMGIKTVGYDQNENCSLSGLPHEMNIVLGRPPNVSSFDLVVPSPGIHPKTYTKARRVLGDIELSFRELNVPIIAVTGTNGKSTTVKLITDLLCSLGHRAKAGGNFGVPALNLLADDLDFAVLEVSSFQLETVEHFRPSVGILLNLSEDHLDRHGTFQNYARMKARIFHKQTKNDIAITSVDDRLCDRLAQEGDAVQLRFGKKEIYSSLNIPNSYMRDHKLNISGQNFSDKFEISKKFTEIIPIENFLASALALESLGISARNAFDKLGDFDPLPHRRTRTQLANGVEIIDDSKATNPAAAKTAIELTRGPLIWIAGGRDKGTDFSDLALVAQTRAREAILYGEAAEKIGSALKDKISYMIVNDFEKAVAVACSRAERGDSILLAPACSSFDQFQNFEQRGQSFKKVAESVAIL